MALQPIPSAMSKGTCTVKFTFVAAAATAWSPIYSCCRHRRVRAFTASTITDPCSHRHPLSRPPSSRTGTAPLGVTDMTSPPHPRVTQKHICGILSVGQHYMS
eukprot:750092-Hanusia_phi.AAC.3